MLKKQKKIFFFNNFNNKLQSLAPVVQTTSKIKKFDGGSDKFSTEKKKTNPVTIRQILLRRL